MNQPLRLQIENNISELNRLNALLEQLAKEWKIPKEISFQINLALEEMVTNVINYGYEDKSSHTITLSFILHGNVIIIQIEDDGRAFNPLTAPEPDTTEPAEKRKIGGLGIHLVKELMDTVTYVRKNEKNILTIQKKL